MSTIVYDASGNRRVVSEDPSPTLYVGRVDENGDAVSLPSGWTCAEQAAGQVRVTHTGGLDPDEYAVIVTQHDEVDAGHFIWTVNAADSFDVFFRDVDNNAETEGFAFMMRITG